jgi:Zn-dependent protease
MLPPLDILLYSVSTWIVPLVVAITFHEAAHGYVARLLGDRTAWQLGRVTFNPLKHLDPFGTVILPALLLLLRSPVLFGYAKPVPVDFRVFRHPRRDTILVAAAGPATNLGLALIAGAGFHVLGYLPAGVVWASENLQNALIINIVLAIFNMLPLPPLDGGRIAVAVLPATLSSGLEQLEPYGLPILVGLLFVLPVIGAQLGVNLNFVSDTISSFTVAMGDVILRLTGNM